MTFVVVNAFSFLRTGLLGYLMGLKDTDASNEPSDFIFHSMLK